MSNAVPSEPIAVRITSARSELQETLDAIEDRLNVPKRVGKLTAKMRACYGDNPVPWRIGAVAAVAVIGGLVAWAVLSDE